MIGRPVLSFLPAVLLLLPPVAASAQAGSDAIARSVTIVQDEYGVPHIYGAHHDPS
jgi:acyl-homoserine lactone acylase PvdQ